MKKIKAIIVIIITLLPLWGIMFYIKKYPMNYMDDEYPYWKANKDFISQKDTYYKYIVLGDSVPNGAMIPQIISEDFYNMAIGGGSTVEAYYEMQTYLENNDAPQVVFINFHPGTLGTSACFSQRTLYFNYLSYEQQRDFFEVQNNLDDKEYVNEYNLRRADACRLGFPKEYLPALINSSFRNRYLLNTELYRTTIANRGRYMGTVDNVFSNSDPSVMTTYSSWKPNITADLYYRKLIDLLLQYNVKIYIEMAPIKQSSADIINEQVWIDLDNYYNELKRCYPNIQISTNTLIYPDFCFCDLHHVNVKGAVRYSHYICDKYPFLKSDRISEEKISFFEQTILFETVLEMLDDDSFSVDINNISGVDLQSNEEWRHQLSNINVIQWGTSIENLQEGVVLEIIVYDSKSLVEITRVFFTFDGLNFIKL